MGISIDKIKIKYILGTYKSSSDYPTDEDILFLMTKWAADRGEDLTNITFTTTKLLKKLDDFKIENVDKSLNDLLDKGLIELIRETKDSKTYKIISNPYLDLNNGI